MPARTGEGSCPASACEKYEDCWHTAAFVRLHVVDVVTFVDHGDPLDRSGYLAASQGKRNGVGPGDELSLEGAELRFVAGREVIIEQGLGEDTPNPHCEDAVTRPPNGTEDDRSLGYRFKVGNFEFFDLGDLTWRYLHELACPVNLLGTADLLQVVRHGQNGSSPPQLLNALSPSVAIFNNGAQKGNDLESYENVTRIPGLQDHWQLHRSSRSGPQALEDQIANLAGGDADQAHFISVTVNGDSFTVRNSRNDFEKTYAVK